jgi:HSP20 family protein
MAIVRWSDPFRDVASLQDRINRLFADAYGQAGAPAGPGGDEGLLTSGNWVPPVDIYHNGDQEVVLKAELPDMTREDIDITVDNGTLTIKGEKKFSKEVKEEQFHRIERRYGSFSRSFALPRSVDATKVGADYRNGVLTVRLPLREDAKPRQIKVDVTA